ncbi:MAG: ureidoglycolate lyase [Spirochaetaceae bacterium]
MKEITLKVEELSQEAFAPYGAFVRTGQQDPAFESEDFNFWNKLAILDLNSVSVGLVRSFPKGQMVSTTFEQHARSTETLIPADGEVVLVLAEPESKDTRQINLDTVKAFRLQAGDSVVLHRNTWHFAPLVKDKPVKTWVIFEEDTPDNDLFMRHVDQENDIKYVVTGA